MKNNNYIDAIIWFLIIVVSFVLVFSVLESSAKEKYCPLSITSRFNEIDHELELYILEDEETGVNYIVTTTDGKFESFTSIAIIERLNPDGTLYVSK